ncbi:hypothetical protein FPQ18DRAFT_390451 [Pyronema domesticum]|uniref:Uncharacterized protein n=1 Tax=Pyronema omphalodes (strain CBS 100304) TaxID=1076935 RepID=U4LNV2_PYROM|nr:hypothetical protein FPQ18DRAFT_390451 [Pyronema domesticum]CCX33806.1 Protein of unknown function [Pyronema omphalodes CBS 100304]
MADVTIHCSAIHFLAVGACAQDLLDHVRECITHYPHTIEQENVHESNGPGNAVLKILYNELFRTLEQLPCDKHKLKDDYLDFTEMKYFQYFDGLKRTWDLKDGSVIDEWEEDEESEKLTFVDLIERWD